jgi:hypothetical protein
MINASSALAAIEIAERHAARSPSAALCLADARICYVSGDPRGAARRALKSLAYSVGVADGDYARAAILVREAA